MHKNLPDHCAGSSVTSRQFSLFIVLKGFMKLHAPQPNLVALNLRGCEVGGASIAQAIVDVGCLPNAYIASVC